MANPNEKTIDRRVSELVFKRHKFTDVLNSYEPIRIKTGIFRSEIRGYRCKECSEPVTELDRLRHYAQYHFDIQTNRGSE